MVSAITRVFEKQFEDLDKIIIDEYMPKEGTYIIVKPNHKNILEEYSRVEVVVDKKNKTINREIENFNLLCKLDYNSNLLDLNKSMDTKKMIHSNNYLSFFIKKENLTQNKLSKDIIDGYYEVFKNPMVKYGKKSKSKELYLSIEEKIGEVNIERLENIKLWIEKNIFNLNLDISKKNYLKVFFLYEEKSFEIENSRYLTPNLYNNNDYNITINDVIYGLPNNNIGLNSKKPYLENKTRKSKVPHLIEINELIQQKKLFDFLYNCASQGKYNIYVNDTITALKDGEFPKDKFNGYYLRLKKSKEVEIHDFDIISCFNFKMSKDFEYINYLKLSDEYLYKNNKDNSYLNYGIISTIKDMQGIINEVLFSNLLITNYHSDDISIKDISYKNCISNSREKLYGWFYKGQSLNIWPLLKKICSTMITNNLERGYFIKASNIFNLKYSLENYFNNGGNSMEAIMRGIRENLRAAIVNNEELTLNNDKEFSYAVGQLTNYLINKDKNKNKPLSLLNPIINCKNEERLKYKLRNLFKRFNCEINGKINVRFKKLYSLILEYKVEKAIDEDYIIAGYLSNNILYEKREQTNNE